MALLTRSTLGLGLLVGAAFVLAAGCGSSDKKAATRGDGGEAGAVAAPGGDGGQAHGGSSSTAGAAGEVASVGGVSDGGASPIAGGTGGTSPNQAGEASVGGVPAFDCTPAGDTVGLSFKSNNTFRVCRGALGLLNFSVQTTDQQFVCCGTSSGRYGFEGHGLSDNDGGGDVTFLVPPDAPLGAQTLNLTCAAGVIATPISINVTDDGFPVVDSVTATVAPNGNVTIVGSNLLNVDRMRAVPVDPNGEQFYCNIDTQSATAEKVTCKLSGGTPAGDYVIGVFTAYCGATNSPKFKVIVE
jgi:hypothetical protein